MKKNNSLHTLLFISTISVTLSACSFEDEISCDNEELLTLAESVFAENIRDTFLLKQKKSMRWIGGDLYNKGFLDYNATIHNTPWERWVELSDENPQLRNIITTIQRGMDKTKFKLTNLNQVAINKDYQSVNCTATFLSPLAKQHPVEFSGIITDDNIEVNMQISESFSDWGVHQVATMLK